MNWSEIIAKRTPVRSEDNASFGYVAAEYEDNFLVIEGTVVSREYLIPKNKVSDYNGKELSLTMRHDEISPDFQF